MLAVITFGLLSIFYANEDHIAKLFPSQEAPSETTLEIINTNINSAENNENWDDATSTDKNKINTNSLPSQEAPSETTLEIINISPSEQNEE